jgi:hypothetical protein
LAQTLGVGSAQVYGDHVQTAEALSSLGALRASLGDLDAMRLHYSRCLEMLHRLDEVDRFSVVLSDFVGLCVQVPPYCFDSCRSSTNWTNFQSASFHFPTLRLESTNVSCKD